MKSKRKVSKTLKRSKKTLKTIKHNEEQLLSEKDNSEKENILIGITTIGVLFGIIYIASTLF